MNDWASALKDGSVINVLFPDNTQAKARFNIQASRWEVQRDSGDWVGMEYEHGARVPNSWWAST